MSRIKNVNPIELFDEKTLADTDKFIYSIPKKDIIKYRNAYLREMNKSNDDNVLPETTLNLRRCFLYLTHHYETLNL